MTGLLQLNPTLPIRIYGNPMDGQGWDVRLPEHWNGKEKARD